VAAITFEITIGKGDATSTRQITVDPDDMPLGFNEDFEAAQESGKWRDLNKALAEFLGLTHLEVRAITNRQFKDLMAAIAAASQEATAIPNG
jgi:hypothetical protein